jgi:hypothetical protein
MTYLSWTLQYYPRRVARAAQRRRMGQKPRWKALAEGRVWVYAASTREGGVDYKYIYSLVVDLRSFLRVR